jgi:hypothetical protein
MIDPKSLDIASLPVLPMDAKTNLPKESGIYFALNSEGRVLYVGQTVNLKKRWVNHHRYVALNKIGGVSIAYLFAAPELLSSLEEALIEFFKPPFNGNSNKGQQGSLGGSKAYFGKSVTPIEIDREIKVMAELVAYLHGHRHGDRGSLPKFVRPVLTGEYLVVPNRVIGWAELVPQIQEILLSYRDREKSRQPFSLRYRHSHGSMEDFSVLYGEVTVHEARFYLDAWVAEPGGPDVPALQHNRCFRLDRIQQVNGPVSGEWRDRLDSIQVVFELSGGLARGGYEKRPEDLSIEHLGTPQDPCLRVTREVSNTFWFIREMLSYGQNYQVIAPVEVLERVRNEVTVMFKKHSG